MISIVGIVTAIVIPTPSPKAMLTFMVPVFALYLLGAIVAAFK